jgi:hypothetical protein
VAVPVALEPEPEPEPEPVAAVPVALEPEPEPEPVVAVPVALEPEPEPEPVVAVPVALEPEPELDPVVGGSPGQVGPRWMCISCRVSGSSPLALTWMVRLSPETAREAVPETPDPLAATNEPVKLPPPAVAVLPADDVPVGLCACTAEAMRMAPSAAGAAIASRMRAAFFEDCMVSVPFR